MPTAAKLVAAVVFALVGWLAANAHVPSQGENADVGLFREITAAIGAASGWMVMGPLAGHGYVEALSSGLRTVATLVFFALLGFSVYEMVMTALTTNAYGSSPMNAVLGIFKIMMDQGQKMLTVGVLGVLAIGAVVGGVTTEWAKRRWR